MEERAETGRERLPTQRRSRIFYPSARVTGS